MDCTTKDASVERLSLLDSLVGEWIKLPLAAVQDVGPAAQTLGGLLALTTKETFAATSSIAQRARLPLPTVRKHLAILDGHGWIENKGRGSTRSGKPRRTTTITVTKQTRDAIQPYGVLPWWACCSVRRAGKLPWAARATLAVVMARLLTLKAAAERDGPDDDLEGLIENMDGAERFRFSLTELTQTTGLSRESVCAAKRRLARLGVFDLEAGDTSTATADCLAPNWEFRVVVTPAPKGGCFLSFEH